MSSSSRYRGLLPLLIAIIVGACSAPAAHAAKGGMYGVNAFQKNIELTAFDGYYIASDLYTSISGVGNGGHIGLENSNEWGGRIGINPSPGFGFEFAYTRIGSDIKVGGSYGGYNPQNLGRIDGNEYDFNFLFSQPIPYQQRAAGFFTLGLGWTATEPHINSLSGKTFSGNDLFAWNFGLGTKISLTERFFLRLEGRWRITDTNVITNSGVWCDYYGYCYSYASSTYNSGELTAGLTYRLNLGH